MQKLDTVLTYQLNTLLRQKPLERGHAAAFWPRMACSPLCRYTLEMRRFHGSCFWCRIRRLFYGKMDPKKYHYNSLMGIVFPVKNRLQVLFVGDRREYVIHIDCTRRFAKIKYIIPLVGERPEYEIFIDCTRRFAKIKDVPLAKVLKFAEWLGNQKRLSRTCWAIRKHVLTLAEGLAN